MILRHRDWDDEKKLEREMIVRDFINEIVLTDENKGKKYYKISTKDSLHGKQNLIIYYQNSTIKSHHSSGIESDFNKVSKCEIVPYYIERTIRPKDIISMDLNFKK